ncbi:MAG: hypothetical protein IRY90_15745, partial [Actinomadura rubrobrunea]|nr:hypothetical protein [Actinomadura rubrobrunea]
MPDRLRAVVSTIRSRLPRLRPSVPSKLSAVASSRWTRILAVLAIGLAGGLVGLLLGGRVVTAVGPTDVSLALRPAWTGGTVVQ